MTTYLRSLGHHLNHKRVERLMRKMALEGVAPKRNLSKAKGESHRYPYLLDGMKIQEPDVLWCSDITYIRMKGGYIYLEALEKGLMKGKPRIFNTDQGSQFTSSAITGTPREEAIRKACAAEGECGTTSS